MGHQFRIVSRKYSHSTAPGTYFATIAIRLGFLDLRLNIEGAMRKLITLIGLLTTVSTLALADDAKMQYVDVRDQHGNIRKFSRLIMGTDHLLQTNWTHQGPGVTHMTGKPRPNCKVLV